MKDGHGSSCYNNLNNKCSLHLALNAIIHYSSPNYPYPLSWKRNGSYCSKLIELYNSLSCRFARSIH